MKNNIAFRWYEQKITPILFSGNLKIEELLCIDRQKQLVISNIESFLVDKPFLNMLLWGEKGGGKSSLVKAVASNFSDHGLRIVEFLDDNIKSVFKLFEIIRNYDIYKFIVYFDDISFDEDDKKFRDFKSVIEGSLEEPPANLMYVATSNRRHIIAERASDTNDIYSRDDINEKASLFARFGLVVGFYPLGKNEYLKIAKFYFDKFNLEWDKKCETDAENFAIERGGRSGRIAKQFGIFSSVLKNGS